MALQASALLLRHMMADGLNARHCANEKRAEINRNHSNVCLPGLCRN
jgi:hypothetical protein